MTAQQHHLSWYVILSSALDRTAFNLWYRTNSWVCQIVCNCGAEPLCTCCWFVRLPMCWSVWLSLPALLMPSIICFVSTLDTKKGTRKELCAEDSDCFLFLRMSALWWHALFFLPRSYSSEAIESTTVYNQCPCFRAD